MGRRARDRDDAPFGVLLVDKPEGPTSHDVVGWLRWTLGVRQVGHCGTLDPAASGLLVICVGAATRFVPYLTGVAKSYQARVILGVATDSADREGQVTQRADAALVRSVLPRAGDALRSMIGTLELPPPVFSAIKQDGQRAHRRARRGETVELAPRPMTVHSVADVAVAPDGAWVDAQLCVSKGTYIRSLAVELGRRLGVPAHLGALRRTACGELALAGALPVLTVAATPVADEHRRVRCHLPGPPQDRAATRAQVTAALLDPAVLVPMPVLDSTRAEGLLTRLVHGQDAQLSAANAHALDLPAGAEIACVCGQQPRVYVVVELEPDGSTGAGYRLRPRRVIRAPTPSPAPSSDTS